MHKVIFHTVDDGAEMPLGEAMPLVEGSGFTGAIGRIFLDCPVPNTKLVLTHPDGMVESFILKEVD